MKKIILAGIVFIVSAIAIILYIINSSNGIPKTELEKKAYELLGNDYCITDHSMECGGDALTEYKCKLCGIVEINPDTNVPTLCTNCARLTERCSKCGNLEK